MRASLRIAAEFNEEIATEFGVPGINNVIIIDDAANLLHLINVEYAEDGENQLYRRLNYTIKAMQTMKVVLKTQNAMAEQLLYKIATALSGSTLGYGRLFDTSMFILPPGEVWDEVLPTDKPKKKAPAKKEDPPENEVKP